MNPLSSEQKQALRQQVSQALQNLSTAERAADSRRICELLRAQPVWREARAVLLFAPAYFEPDVRPLLDQGLRAGKIVTLPGSAPATGLYRPRRVEQPGCNLEAGPFGILEPGPGCPIFPTNQLDFVLVPGIAFTPNGGRLGRGKGHYDRLLAEVRGFKCGVAFDCQVLADLPLEAHDVRLNCILTPTRWHLVATAPVLK